MKTILRDDAFPESNIFDVNEDFGGAVDESNPLKPRVLTELALAEVFARNYKDTVRYNGGIGFIVWNKKVWELSDSKAQKKYFEFIKKVAKLAQNELYQALNTGDEKIIKDAENFVRFARKMQEGTRLHQL